MPSRDSTGKVLSGAEKRRRAEDRARRAWGMEGAAPPAPPLEVPPPPAGHIDEGVAWAARIQAAAACRARAGQDFGRVRALGGIVQKLGKLRGLAQDSERVMRTLRAYRGQDLDVRAADPPDAPVALAAWAWWQLAALLYEVATQPEVDEGAIGHRARALSALGAVFPHRDLAQLDAELQRDLQED